MDSYTFSSVNVSNITVGGNRERGMPPFYLIGNASISGMLNLIGDINIGTSTGNGIILKRKSDSDFGSVNFIMKANVTESVKIDYKIETKNNMLSHFFNNNLTLSFNLDGNVGIGTDQQQNKLDVEGGMAIGVGFSGVETAPENGAIIKGSVGIGTSSIQNKLDVEGGMAIGIGFSGVETAPENGAIIKGSVGIGISNTINTLDVFGNTAIGTNYSGSINAPLNGVIIEGSVGIGTSNPNPNKALHVVGDTYIEGRLIVTESTIIQDTSTETSEQLIIINNGTGPALIINQEGDNALIDFQDDGNTEFYIKNGGLVGIGTKETLSKLGVKGNASIGNNYSDILAPQNGLLIEGSVGIGTDNPKNKLDINGNLVIGSSYSAISEAPQDGLLIEGSVGIGTDNPKNKLDINGNIVIGSSYSAISEAPQNGLLIEGNVGIGTTDPKSKLDINGNLVIGSSYSGISEAPQDGLLIEGNVGIGTTDPKSKLDVKGSVLIENSLSVGNVVIEDSLSVGNVVIEDSLSVGNIVIFKDKLLVEKNVGIGINDPKSKVDINGNMTIGSNYSGVETAPTDGLLVEGSFGLGTNNPKSKLDVEGSVAIGSNYSGTIAAPTNGLLVEGSFGLGTSTPQNKLDIEGGIAIGIGFSGVEIAPDNGAIIKGSVGIGTSNIINTLDISGNTAIGLNYSGITNAPINGVIIEGNVGIGTSNPNPNKALHVVGDTYIEGRLIVTESTIIQDTSTETSEQLIIVNNGTGPALIINQEGDNALIDFQDDGNTEFFIKNGGLVGIGTKEVLSKLGVKGNVSIGNNYANILAPINGLLIEGNVGIGTNNPESKLHIEGNVKIQGDINCININNDNLITKTANIDIIDVKGGNIEGSDINVGIGQYLNVSQGNIIFRNEQISGNSINGGTINTINISKLEINEGILKNTDIVIGNDKTLNVFNGLLKIPCGNINSRPTTDLEGQFRYNTDLGNFEVYLLDSWKETVTTTSVNLINNAFGSKITTGSNLDFFTKLDNEEQTKKMTIKKDGKIGIGIDEPLQHVHINSDSENALMLTCQNGDDYGKVTFTLRTDISDDVKQYEISQNGTLVKHNFNNNLHIIFDGNGNTGLGTITPKNRLDVEGSSSIGDFFSGKYLAPDNGLLVQGRTLIGFSGTNEATFPYGYVHIHNQDTTNDCALFLSSSNSLTEIDNFQDSVSMKLYTNNDNTNDPKIFEIKNDYNNGIELKFSYLENFTNQKTSLEFNENKTVIINDNGLVKNDLTVENLTKLKYLTIGENFINIIPPNNGATIEGRTLVGFSGINETGSPTGYMQVHNQDTINDCALLLCSANDTNSLNNYQDSVSMKLYTKLENKKKIFEVNNNWNNGIILKYEIENGNSTSLKFLQDKTVEINDNLTVTNDLNVINNLNVTNDLNAPIVKSNTIVTDSITTNNLITNGTVETININNLNVNNISSGDITLGLSNTLDVSRGELIFADGQISGENINGGIIDSITITDLNAPNFTPNFTKAIQLYDYEDRTPISNDIGFIPFVDGYGDESYVDDNGFYVKKLSSKNKKIELSRKIQYKPSNGHLTVPTISTERSIIDHAKIEDLDLLMGGSVDFSKGSDLTFSTGQIYGDYVNSGTIDVININSLSVLEKIWVPDNSISGNKIEGGTIDNLNISKLTMSYGDTLDIQNSEILLADKQISGNKINGGTIDNININFLNIKKDLIVDNVYLSNHHRDPNKFSGQFWMKAGGNSYLSAPLLTLGGIVKIELGDILDVSDSEFKLADDQISGDKINGGTIDKINIDDSFTSKAIIDNLIITDRISIPDNGLSGNCINWGTVDNLNISNLTMSFGDSLDIRNAEVLFSDKQINGDKINGGSIDMIHIKDLGVDRLNIPDNSLSGNKINWGTIDNMNINNLTLSYGDSLDIQNAEVLFSNNQISGNKINGGTIDMIHIQDLGVDRIFIPDNSLSGNCINWGTVDNLNVSNLTLSYGDTIDIRNAEVLFSNNQISGDIINGGSIDSISITNIVSAISIGTGREVPGENSDSIAGYGGAQIEITDNSSIVKQDFFTKPSGSDKNYASARIESGWEGNNNAWNKSYIKFQTHGTSGSGTFTDDLKIEGGEVFINKNLKIGSNTTNYSYTYFQSTPGWLSGIRMYRGDGSWSDNSNNSFGIVVSDKGCNICKFDSASETAARTSHLVVSNDGNVGVGIPGATDHPQAKLHVVGKMLIQPSSFSSHTMGNFGLEVAGGIKCSGAVDTSSDERIKENIEPISNSLSLIEKLKGIKYNFTTEYSNTTINENSNKKRFGLLAQEVEKVLPDIVNTNVNEAMKIDDFKTISYSSLIPILIEAIKELNDKNKQLESKLNKLGL